MLRQRVEVSSLVQLFTLRQGKGATFTTPPTLLPPRLSERDMESSTADEEAELRTCEMGAGVWMLPTSQ